MNIVRGKIIEPVKGIVYGIEGIGKTTFASKWEKPLFLDLEKGSGQLDVDRISPATYAEVKSVITELKADPKGYKTLVIDSCDWLEKMMIQHICQSANIDSIEKYEKGYGKGWNKLAEDWGKLLDELDRIRLQKGLNILFIGHAKIKRYEPADDTGHDRYTLTMNDKTADLLKKWSDLTLFVKYDTYTVEENGKIKVKGGNKRVMYSVFHPCWDAKNRYGLPEKMDLDYDKIKHIFETAPTSMSEPAEPTPEKAPEPVKNPDPVTVTEPEEVSEEVKELQRQVTALLNDNSIGVGELAAQLEKRGYVPAGTPLKNYNEKTLRLIVSAWDKIQNNIKIARAKGN